MQVRILPWEPSNYQERQLETHARETVITGGHHYNQQGELVSGTLPGAFVSPTTVLSIRHNQGLQDWRDRVGPEEADRKSKEATDKGTAVHKAVEELIVNDASNYLSSIDLYVKGFMNWDDKYKPETIAIEQFLRSELNEIAGRVDYICKIDG